MYWLVVHGAWVWQLALAAILLAASLLAVRRSRRRPAAEARAKRAALGAPRRRLANAPDGAVVTLAGTLRASGTPCASFVDGAAAAATSAGPEDVVPPVIARAGQLEVVLEDGSARIEGPVTVVAGAREQWTERRIEALSPRILALSNLGPRAWVSKRPAVFRAVANGDAVVVRGVLRRGDGGDGPAGYRESAASWILGPVPPAHDVEASSVLVAAERAPSVGGPVGRAVLGGACAGFAIFAATFVALPATRPLYGVPARDAAPLAATPLRRAEAVETYRAALGREVARGRYAPASLEQLVEMDLAAGLYRPAAEVLLEHGRWARAADLGERCGLPDVAGRAAFELGDFARAARSLGFLDRARWPAELRADKLRVRVLLLAGDLGGAEVAARDILAAAAQHGWADQADVRALACVADALAARRGDGPARERLRGSPVAECAVLAWDLGESEDPYNAWERPRTPVSHPVTQQIADVLGSDMGAASARLVPSELLLRPASGPLLWGLMPAFRARLKRLGAVPGDFFCDYPTQTWRHAVTAVVVAEQARFALATGDRREAAALVDLCTRELRGADDPGALKLERAALRGAATGDFDGPPLRDAAHALLALGGGEQKGRDPVFSLLFDLDPDADPRVLSLAGHGDGSALADLLWEQGSASEVVLRAIALTDRTREGRDEVLRWARWGRVTRCIGCGVVDTFSDVSARLALAEAFGDEALAAELRPALASFRAALIRGETAAPLAIFESLRLEWTLGGH